MQGSLFNQPDTEGGPIRLDHGLAIEIAKGLHGLVAKLYRFDLLIKHVELSDKVARRLLIVEAVEMGANQSRLAEVLKISRQTIHNYMETQRVFGREGLINSYSPTTTKTRAKQRKIKRDKLPKGNKAILLAEFRKKEKESREKDTSRQLPLQFSFEDEGTGRRIDAEEQLFSEEHSWEVTRYAGIFLYVICLISRSNWLKLIEGYFGNAYKIFMAFLLMVCSNIGSIEQLKNVRKREAALILGLPNLPSRPKIWQWFYNAAKLGMSHKILNDYFRYQLRIGLVSTWFWFVDGHLLPYTGKEKVHYAYNTQRRMVMPGRTNIVTCDVSGRIVDFEIKEGKGDLCEHIISLDDKWSDEVPGKVIKVFDREGYGAQFFYNLMHKNIYFVTWDKYVDQKKMTELSDELFTGDLEYNGKKYRYFEGEKTFTVEGQDQGGKSRTTFELRRLYIWNQSSNRRTCGLAWTGDEATSTEDCLRAILTRWAASENTFKHLRDRHPWHYHPGFKTTESERQDIANPEIKEKVKAISGTTRELDKRYKKLANSKEALNKDGSPRKNSVREHTMKEISELEETLRRLREEKKKLPDRVDVSQLTNYKSFKRIDNEGKNLFDFVTSSVWNARKEMVDWLRPYFNQDNEVVDLFYAITNCHGWVRSTKEEVRVRLEPLQQPKRRMAQEQLCRKLTYLVARVPSGKLLVVEVGDSPLEKLSKK